MKWDSNRREKIKVIEGCEGKAKGMLQVLWERGFVNTAEGEKKAYQNYSIKGYNDQFGNHRPETSLKELMSSCKDFVEEETMLQSIARDLGVCIDRTPKCHCELAGEGIEYAWAWAKFCIAKDYLGPNPSFGPDEFKRIFSLSRQNYVNFITTYVMSNLFL